jgi:hypothetical protein
MILVKALKGETPFGADTGDPNADFNRRPSGLPPVSDAEIATIQQWIDKGCQNEEVAELIDVGLLGANGDEIGDFGAVILSDIGEGDGVLMDIHPDEKCVGRDRLFHG